ncbi:6-pyruvoyl trahydropterin synthase family protein [Aquimarina rhabdastrellae]
MKTPQYRTAIIRKEHFNAAHRLHNAHWSDEKNKEVFGKCNNPHYHGHNYDLEVKIIGICNPETGYVMDTKVLSELIKTNILTPLDHKNLNLEVEDFKNLNPTVEHIAMVIYDRLRSHIDPALELKIKLYETERNYAEYPY